MCVDRPIHDAIESGCLDLVKVLISHGADPQAEFGEKTPMEYALSIDQMEIYKYLEGLTEDISTYLTHFVLFYAVLQYAIIHVYSTLSYMYTVRSHTCIQYTLIHVYSTLSYMYTVRYHTCIQV